MRRGESVTMASGFSKIDFYARRMRMEARIEEGKIVKREFRGRFHWSFKGEYRGVLGQ